MSEKPRARVGKILQFLVKKSVFWEGIRPGKLTLIIPKPIIYIEIDSAGKNTLKMTLHTLLLCLAENYLARASPYALDFQLLSHCVRGVSQSQAKLGKAENIPLENAFLRFWRGRFLVVRVFEIFVVFRINFDRFRGFC